MIVRSALEHFELFDHLTTERVFGKHTLDRLDNGFIRIFFEKMRILLLFKPAHIAGVVRAEFLISLVARERDLIGIDDDNEIADVRIGRIFGFGLAFEHGRDNACKPTERNARRVYNEPTALVLLVADFVVGRTGINLFCH